MRLLMVDPRNSQILLIWDFNSLTLLSRSYFINFNRFGPLKLRLKSHHRRSGDESGTRRVAKVCGGHQFLL